MVYRYRCAAVDSATLMTDEIPATHAHTKFVQLTLTYFKITGNYEVKQITNSTWYKPGDWLGEDVVKIICARNDWDVIMNAPDWNLPFLPVQLPK